MIKKLVSVLLVALLVTSIAVFTVNTFASQDVSVEVLIRNAQRLKSMAHEKFNTLTSQVNKTLYADNISLIANLLATADAFLNQSIELYNSGNVTGAKESVIYAINIYDDAIEATVEVAKEAGIVFQEREGLKEPQNETEFEQEFEGNATNALNRTALTLQLQVLEARINTLESQLSKVNQSQYNLSQLFYLLSYAKNLLLQTKAGLASGNVSVSLLARNLAIIKKILGLVNAELNRISLHVTVIRAMKLGLLKKNETAYLNTTLLNHTLPKLKELRNRTRTGLNETEAVLEEVEAEVRNTSHGINTLMKELKEKIKERHGFEKNIDPGNQRPPKEKPLPPGLEKKLSENREEGEQGGPKVPGSQGKGRGK